MSHSITAINLSDWAHICNGSFANMFSHRLHYPSALSLVQERTSLDDTGTLELYVREI